MDRWLVVVDMQNDFVDGSLGTAEAMAIVPAVLEKVRSFDGKIVFTKDTHLDHYMETQEGRNLPVIHCLKGSDGWDLIPELEEFARDKRIPVIEKDTFGSRDLPEFLKENSPDGIESVTFIGLCTDICVISNAMVVKAFFPEVPLLVDPACCAGVTPESHERALAAMQVCQIAMTD